MAITQTSAQARGVIVILEGNAWLVTTDGTRKPLKVGDEVQEGQQIITEDGTRLELALPNGQPLMIASGRELLVDGNLLGTDPTDKTEAALKDLNSGSAQITKVIANGGDLSVELDPTAAGLSGGDASDSHSFVRVLRISEELTPLALTTEPQITTIVQPDLAIAAQVVTSSDQPETDPVLPNEPVVEPPVVTPPVVVPPVVEPPVVIPPVVTPPVETPPAVITVSSPSVGEGGNLDFVLTLSSASTTPTTVTLTPASGTGASGAILGTDTAPAPTVVSFDGGTVFVPIVGNTVTMPAGAISFIVRLPTTPDGLIEGTETLTLGAATPGNSAPVVGTGTITDIAVPTLSISGETLVNEAAGTLTYTVTLSAASLLPVTVAYSAANGTALLNSDYGAPSGTGTLTFAPGGPLTQTFTVAINNDAPAVFEGAEAYTVNLTAPTNASIVTGSVTTTIMDNGTGFVPPGTPADNDTPTLSVSSVTVSESTPGFAVFTVSLDHTSTAPTTLSLALANGPAGATGATGAGVDFGTTGAGNLQVLVAGVWVDATTATIGAGQTSVQVRTPVNPDAAVESAETFTLTATTTAGTTTNASAFGTGTITDIAVPTLSISGETLVNEAAGTLTYTVTLSAASLLPVTVAYSAANGTALLNSDYGAPSGTGTLTFAPGGPLTQTFTVAINNDAPAVFEGAEAYTVNLTAPTNASIVTGSVTTTIMDNGTGFVPPGTPADNDTPTLSVSSVTVSESTPGFAVFTVSLDHTSTAPTTLSLALANGPAGATGATGAGVDFGTTGAGNLQVLVAGVWVDATTATIGAGQTSVQVRTPVNPDAAVESAETFTLTATTTAGTTTNASAFGTGTITDIAVPTLSISGETLVNEAAGTLTYTVTLSAASLLPVTVAYSAANGTALLNSDYGAPSGTGTLTFAPGGPLTQTFTVAINNDAPAVFEGAEAYTVNLTAPTNASIVTGSVTTTIMDNGTGFVPPGTPADNDTPTLSVSSVTVSESTPGFAVFTVSLDHTSTAPTTLSLALANGPAGATGATGAGVDFGTTGAGNLQVLVAGVWVDATTATIGAGQTSVQVRTPVNPDAAVESAETFTLTATTTAGTTTNASAFGTGTITDIAVPTLSISGETLVNEAAGTLTYTVTLSAASLLPVTVAYSAANGTALLNSDYGAPSGTGTLTFAPGGPLTQTFTVAINNDAPAVFEGAEAYTVNLTAPTNASIVTGSVTTTIMDNGTGFVPPGTPADNDTPTLSVSSVTVSESTPGFAVFTVSLDHTSTAPTTLSLALANGPAGATGATGAGVDFGTTGAGNLQVLVAGVWVDATTATIGAGQTSVQVRTPVNPDAAVESAETFTLTATTTAGTTTNASAFGTGTITDIAVPTLSISGETLVNEAAGTLTYTVTLSAASLLPVTVAYSAANGTALLNSDYGAPSGTGTLTFAPGGPLTQTFTVAINNDAPAVFEGAEAYTVNLTAPTNASIVTGSVTTTIMDNGTGFVPPGTPADNDTPTLSVSSVTVSESTPGFAVFTVSLDHTSTAPTTLSLALANGPAGATGATGAGVDFGTTGAGNLQVLVAGVWVDATTATIGAGQTSVQVRTPVNPDAAVESAETFTLTATTTAGTTTNASAFGTGTITDIAVPTLSISGETLVNEAAGTLTYTVTLSAASLLPVTVAYSAANGTALLNSDYGAPSGTGTLTFAPGGPLTQTFTVAINNDAPAVFEGAEAYTVNLTAPTNASIVTGSVTTTIMDNGTGFVPPGTPADNDTPTLSVSSVTVSESTPGFAVFTVSLDHTSTAPTTLSLALANGPAGATGATGAGVDFGTTGAGNLQVLVAGVWVDATTATIGAGQTSVQVRTPVNPDAAVESAETFTLTATTTAGTTTNASAFGTGTITDIAVPTLSISGETLVNEAAGTLTYTVTLSAASLLPVTVAYSAANGTALLNSDYGAPSGTGTLTFAPGGPLTQTFTVAINNDAPAVFEGAEAYTVNLTAPTNASIVTGSVTTTIMDNGTGFVPPGTPADNDTPTLSVSSVTVSESTPGFAVFTVSLDHTSTAPTTLSLALANGPAGATGATGAGVDFGTTGAGNLQVLVAGVWVDATTATIGAGQTSVQVRTPVNPDAAVESAETFTLTATTTAGTTTNASAFGTGTITDIAVPTLSISGETLVNEAAGTLTYTVTLSAASLLPVTVAYSAANGTALLNSDYGAPSGTGTLTFAPGGPLTQTFTVAINNDAPAVFEGAEAYTVNLTAPTNASIVTGSVTTTIMDNGTGFVPPGTPADNDTPTLSVSSVTVSESTPGFAVFTVSLDHTSTAPTTLSLALANGPAGATGATGAGVDFGTTGAGNLQVLVAGVWVDATTATIGAGQTSVQVRTPVNPDAAVESAETFTLTATTTAGTTTNASAFGTGTITDIAVPTLSISGETLVNEAAGTLTYTVTLSAASLLPVTVAYSAANGTALLNSDYGAPSGTGTLTFAPGGPLTQTFTVAINNDAPAVFEGAEAYTVNLTAPTNASIVTGSVTTTIMDNGTGFVPPGTPADNDTPTLSVSSVTVSESTPGFAVFTVSLDHTSTAPTTLSLALANGPAGATGATGAGVDFGTTGAGNLQVLVAGVWVDATTATIGAGQTSVQVRTPVNPDAAVESAETFTLTATTTAGTTTNASAFGTGTITDIAVPTLSISGETLVNEAAGTLTYTVTLSAASLLPVTVAYSAANGTALLNSDYGAPSGTGTLTFAPGGPLTQTFTVAINNDAPAVFEGAEAYTVNLTAPTNASIVTGSVTTTIMDNGTGFVPPGTPADNDTPTLSVSSVTVSESTPGFAVFTVSLDHTSTAPTTLSLALANGPAGATGATGAGVDFGTTGAGNLQVLVAGVWVDATTATIGAGQTSVQVRTPVNPDAAVESAETFTLTATTTAGTTTNASAFGTGTITDIAVPTLSISGETLVNEAAGTLTYTVTLSAASLLPVTVAYSAANGTALLNSDYGAPSGTGTLTFAPGGPLTQTFTVAINNDAPAVFEGAEAYTVNLTAPTNASIVTGSVTTTIMDNGTGFVPPGTPADNDTPTLSVSSVTVSESTPGFAVFTVSLDHTSTAPTTLSLALANGPAGATGATGAGVDFGTTGAGNLQVLVAGVWVDATTATIGAGQTSVQVRTPVNPDAAVESAETFTLTATTTAGTTTNASAFGTGTITDTTPSAHVSARWIDYWQFNEGSGTGTTNYNPASDQIGTITNNTPKAIQPADPVANLSPTWTTGRNGSTAMQFNGVGGASDVRDGGYVALDQTVTDALAGQTAAKAATLSVWIKTSQVGGTIGWDSPSIIGMENNGGVVDVQWGFINNEGKIGLGIGNYAGVMSTNAINDDKWHNVVISHDFVTGATSLWVDGVQNVSGYVLAPTEIAPNKFLGFGVTVDDGVTSNRFLNAALEDARIYDGVLTDAQAKAIYETELWGNQGAVIANDGHAIHFSISATDVSGVVLSGLVIGSTVSDVTGANTETVGAGGTVDVTGWGATELVLSNYGTGSFHFAVTGTDTGGHTASQLLSVVNNTDMYAGSALAETLDASVNSNAHVLAGGTGDDTLIGGAGADVMIGGQGSDTFNLSNGGSDTLRWVLGDATGSPTDTVNNFSMAAPTAVAGGDILDLRDLLVGELHTGSDAGNLANYLHFTASGGNTTITVTTNDASSSTQSIVLNGVNLTTLGTDQAIIQSLLTNGKLITD